MSKRQGISEQLKNKLLVEANHACTICGRPCVQIHHIDGDPTNNTEDNLIVLCLAHHEEAEKSKTGKGLSANLAPEALHEYKSRLKAGHRPSLDRPALISDVTANLQDVKDSQVIISGGDVTINSPLTSNTEKDDDWPASAYPSATPQLSKDTPPDEFDYDVFISYSHHDERWVWDWLLPRLREADLRVCIDRDCFEPGAPLVTEVERAVLTSRKTLLVLTPDYLISAWAEMENILVATLDPAARNRRLMPLRLKKCDLPLRLKALVCSDFTDCNKAEGELRRLISYLTPSPAFPKRQDEEDYSLLRRFHRSDEDTDDEEPLPWQPWFKPATIDRDESDIHYLDTLLSEDSSSPDNDQRAAWRDQLAIHHKNLRRLEIQLAKYGSLNAPMHLLNQIEDEKAEIERLEDLIKGQ
jgi:hypothetical protein